MAELDVVAYLASKGYQGKQANGPEVTFPCFFDCDEAPNSRKKKLYVNTEDGWYDCKVCGASGGTYKLQKHFGDDPKGETEFEDPHTRRRILNWATDVGSAMLANNDDILLYLFNERGLSSETILERKLGWVGKGWSLTGSLPEEFSRDQLKSTGLIYRDGIRAGQDFFYDHLLIPYISHGNTVQMRGKVMGGKYMTGPGEQVRLYNTDDLIGVDEVIVTEGEFDCMILKQHLSTSPEDRVRKIGVVGIAGANALPPNFETYFADIKRVYLGFDPDDTGKRAAVKVKEMLGTRARIIELPNELPKVDWTDFFVHKGGTWRDVLDLMGTAAGKRIKTMREMGVAYRNRQENVPRIYTGYTGLDAVCQGFLPGQVLIFLAKTGVGKTLMLCNLAYQMRRHKILFLSLEMTDIEVYERMRRIYLFHHPNATDEQVEFALENIVVCDENRLGEKDFVALCDEYEVEMGERPDVILVDYLGYYARGQRGNGPYEKTSNAVMQLKAEAKANKVFVISPSQVNRVAKEGKPIDLDDARDSGAIEETADFLLAIWKPEDALNSTDGAPVLNVQKTGAVKVTALKSRHGNKDKTVSLVMDMLSLAIVEASTPEAKRVAQHNYLAWRGETWEQMRKQELAALAQGTQLSMGQD